MTSWRKLFLEISIAKPFSLISCRATKSSVCLFVCPTLCHGTSHWLTSLVQVVTACAQAVATAQPSSTKQGSPRVDTCKSASCLHEWCKRDPVFLSMTKVWQLDVTLQFKENTPDQSHMDLSSGRFCLVLRSRGRTLPLCSRDGGGIIWRPDRRWEASPCSIFVLLPTIRNELYSSRTAAAAQQQRRGCSTMAVL